MSIDMRKLQAARRVLGTHTDTETVDLALELVAFQSEVFAALDRLADAGGIEDVFGKIATVHAKPGRHSARRRTSRQRSRQAGSPLSRG
jgi:hypothetical protein